jgi:hypothetical protein
LFTNKKQKTLFLPTQHTPTVIPVAFKMMIKSLLSLLLIGTCPFTHAAEPEAVLPSLTFELKSASEGDMRNVLVEMLETTRAHLTSHFADNFASTVWEGYFSDLELSVHNFEVEQGEEHSMKLTYSGVAYFVSDPVPDQENIVGLVTRSFKGDDRTRFIESIVMSSDDFLSDLEYLVISVDEVVVANEDLKYHVSTEEPSSTNYYVIGAVVGAAIGMIIAVFILIYTCRLKKITTWEESQENKLGRENCDADIELKSTSSPSSDHSIISQESSKFTYNPRMLSDESTLPSHFSTLHVDVVQSVDVEAWQRNTISPITPAPFGADISAIELDDKKELSAVEEGPSMAEMSSGYLSTTSLRNLDWNTHARKKQSSYSMSTDNSKSMSDISLHDVDTSSDVISDLKNLSVQIQHCRASYA